MRFLQGIHNSLRSLAVGALLLLTVWLLKDVLLLLFAAVLLACVLHRTSSAVARLTHFATQWSLLIVVVALTALLASFVWWRGAVVIAQAVELGDQFRIYGQQLWDRVSQTSWGPAAFGQLRHALPSSIEGLGGYLTGLASSTLGIAGSLLLVLATALFLALAPRTYIDGSVRLLPVAWRPRGLTVLQEVGTALQFWFLGQLADMLVVAVLIGTGLYVLGVPLSMTLALIAGLLNFIPFIGALAGAVPAVLVAFGQSPTMAVWVAGLFVIVQSLEGNVIAPLIQKRTVSLPPALTIFSQTILGTLFGIIGLILATPLMAATVVLVRMVYVESVLESGQEATAPNQSTS